MGEKGARGSGAGTAMAATLVDALAPLGEVTQRSMFGGHGIFGDGVMFGLVDSEGTAFLRAVEGDSPLDGSVRHGRSPIGPSPTSSSIHPSGCVSWRVGPLPRRVARR